MLPKLQIAVDGQGVALEDLHVLAEAALGEDRALELVSHMNQRVGPGGRSIVPLYPFNSGVGALGVPAQGPLLTPAVGGASLSPFAVHVGPPSVTDPLGGRFAAVLGENTIGFVSTVANNRWDLLYARIDVDINGPSVDRVVKAADGTVGSQSLAVTKNCTVSLGTVTGQEAGSPIRPAVPADGGGAYYVPIAYVFLPHPYTNGQTIAKTFLHEVAPVIRPGAPHCAPVAQLNGRNSQGLSGTDKIWNQQTGTWDTNDRPPDGYLPATMVGEEKRLITLDFETGPSVPLNATTLLDNSIDWRNRIFKFTYQIYSTPSPIEFAWSGGGTAVEVIPSTENTSLSTAGYARTGVDMGQSFRDSGVSGQTAGSAVILYLRHTGDGDFQGAMRGIPPSSTVMLEVDIGGNLNVRVNNVNPACRIVVWLEATAPFHNARKTLV
jgi:hypothetical protein